MRYFVQIDTFSEQTRPVSNESLVGKSGRPCMDKFDSIWQKFIS